jgi:hypothetical protein
LFQEEEEEGGKEGGREGGGDSEGKRVDAVGTEEGAEGGMEGGMERRRGRGWALLKLFAAYEYIKVQKGGGRRSNEREGGRGGGREERGRAYTETRRHSCSLPFPSSA